MVTAVAALGEGGPCAGPVNPQPPSTSAAENSVTAAVGPAEAPVIDVTALGTTREASVLVPTCCSHAGRHVLRAIRCISAVGACPDQRFHHILLNDADLVAIGEFAAHPSRYQQDGDDDKR